MRGVSEAAPSILAIETVQDYPVAMDTLNHETAPETEAERQARLAWEAEGLAVAKAELDAGLYVDVEEVRAWVDSLRTTAPLPPPQIRHR